AVDRRAADVVLALEQKQRRLVAVDLRRGRGGAHALTVLPRLGAGSDPAAFDAAVGRAAPGPGIGHRVPCPRGPETAPGAAAPGAGGAAGEGRRVNAAVGQSEDADTLPRREPSCDGPVDNAEEVGLVELAPALA